MIVDCKSLFQKVVTAAHCVYSKEKRRMSIVAGHVKRGERPGGRAPGVQLRYVKKTVIHP